jgi:hypothetical protein
VIVIFFPKLLIADEHPSKKQHRWMHPKELALGGAGLRSDIELMMPMKCQLEVAVGFAAGLATTL